MKYCKSYLITYGSTEGVYSGEYISYSSMNIWPNSREKVSSRICKFQFLCNDTSTPEGHFGPFPKEREKRGRRDGTDEKRHRGG